MNNGTKSIFAVAGLFWLLAGAAQAAPPNDNWADRVAIGQLPFAQSVPNIPTATNEASDPELFCVIGGRPRPGTNTVWYEYATGAAEEYVDIAADDYDSMIGVFEGTPADGFAMVRGGCNDDDDRSPSFLSSRLAGLRLKANTRYSIVVSVYSTDVDPPATLAFSLSRSTVRVVTKTADTNDGACDADCSLREAIAAATAQPGAVVVPAGTYRLTGALQTENGIAVYGAGMDRTIIDAQGASQAIVHNRGARNTFALHDLTLTGGASTVSGGALQGFVSGYYALDRVAVRASHGVTGGGIGISLGGASVSLFDSVVSGNTASGRGGGLSFEGANIETTGTSFVGNVASGAQATGGALHLRPARDVRLKNTTVSGNRAAGLGGGVYVTPASVSVRAAINNSSIVNNAVDGAPSPQNGGLVFAGTTVPTLASVVTNTVLAGNHSTQDPAAIFDCSRPDTFTLTTGYDLVQSPNGCVFGATGDVTAVDPQLLPLSADPVPVHVPAASSALIDAGDPGASCERTDARGVVRPADGDANGMPRCDIGAVEWSADRDGDRIFADGFDSAG